VNRAGSPTAAPVRVDAVVSAAVLPAPLSSVWNALVFYEQLEGRPSWVLRLLLPVPVRTERRAWTTGAEIRCLYDSGWIVKRLTLVEPPRRCEFEVVLQRLELGGGIRLAGGRYELSEETGASTRLELETRYEGSARPRWFWRPIEAAVCRVFHRHIVESLRLGLVSTAVDERLVRAARAAGSPSQADAGT